MTVIERDQIHTAAPAKPAETGVAAGTVVLTAAGECLVQDLVPGARIITREGVRRLVSLGHSHVTGKAIRICPSALGHDRPGVEVTVGGAQQLYLRDWRAEALYAAPTAKVPATRLVDGEYIREVEVANLPLYTLRFDAPCVIYAGGLQLACGNG